MRDIFSGQLMMIFVKNDCKGREITEKRKMKSGSMNRKDKSKGKDDQGQ